MIRSPRVQKTQVGEKQFASGRLLFPALDRVNEIDLEFLKIGKEIELFLSIHSSPIPSNPEFLHETTLTLEIGEEKNYAPIFRHSGGQRFTVPKETQAYLIEQLRSGKCVTLRLPGYYKTIDPKDFTVLYDRFADPSLLRNPFQLPF